MWICIIQTSMHEFVLIYDRDTRSFEKRVYPLSPGTHECVHLVPIHWDTDACNLRHRLVLFCFCTRTPSEIWDLCESISMPYSQPFFQPGAQDSQQGHALEKNQASLKHHKGNFWCFNAANMNKFIVGGFGNPPVILPTLKWLRSVLRGGGGKSKIGEARFLVHGLAISPP